MALDPTLINRWRSGNLDARNEAWTYFFHLFHERLRILSQSLGYPREDAEEMAVDAIEATFCWHDHIIKKPDSNFIPNEGYAWNLLKKKIWDEIRRKNRELRHQQGSVSLDGPVQPDSQGTEWTWKEILPDPSLTPEDQMLDSPEEWTRKLERFKERLTERRRKFLETLLEAKEILEDGIYPEGSPSHGDLVCRIYQEKYRERINPYNYHKLRERLRKDWQKFNQDIVNQDIE